MKNLVSSPEPREERTEEVTGQAIEKVRETAGELKQRAEDLTASTRFGIRTMAKAYPGQAILASVGLGLLVGLLVGRIVR
jgi:hypothetical protein